MEDNKTKEKTRRRIKTLQEQKEILDNKIRPYYPVKNKDLMEEYKKLGLVFDKLIDLEAKYLTEI